MQLLSLEERANRIFDSYHVSHDVKERYKRDWIRSVRMLGDKWFFAHYVEKLTPEQKDNRANDGTYKLKGADLG